MLGHTRPIAFSAIVWLGAESQDQFDSMLQNAMIQFFNADVDIEKFCYTSMVTFGDDGVPSRDLGRISMADYKKMVVRA